MISRISKYEITEKIHEIRNTAIYRAIRDGDSKQVVIKVLNPEAVKTERLARFRREFEIKSKLDFPGSGIFLDYETHQGSLIIVQDDFGGESLDHLIERKAVGPGEFLPLAIGVTECIEAFHRQGVTHRRINPSHILWNRENGELRIIGFGLADSPWDRSGFQFPKVFEETPTYLSPELTGRVNRPVDFRADFYSLGITFYQILTGKVPFDSPDPLELVHCHLARVPRPPIELNPSIPIPVSNIVMKLLAKNAEERYQTASGLKADLEKCLTWKGNEKELKGFELGAFDASDKLLISQKLYGREKDINILWRAFDRVVGTGIPEMVMVSGYSGIGKTSVIRELSQPIVRERGFFISGKFDQFKRHIPFSTIVDAFRELIQHILTESEERIATWKRQIRKALGINGQIITELVPHLELVIGKQPDVPDLPPVERQNRFNMVFRQFLGVFTKKEHPLVIFLDDLQWVDSASLQLLEHLITFKETRYLLLIGAFRDNEVGPAHPLMHALEEISRTSLKLQRITLGPLTYEDMKNLLFDTFHPDGERLQAITALINEKTAGNPFFLNQFLMTLYSEGLVAFDRGERAWNWDIPRIQAKGFTDNVVDLMVGKLRRFSPATQEALKRAACVGNTVDIRTLVVVHERTEEVTRADLWEAVREGLLLHRGDHYSFLHDRVQQAAYLLIPEGENSRLHLRIGRLLLEGSPPETVEERVFDLVNQLNRGVKLVTDPGERLRMAELNLIAGKKAKVATAFTSALAYLYTGITLLGPDSWVREYSLTWGLHFDAAECRYLCGEFAEAERLFSVLLEHARSKVDIASVYRVMIDLHVTRSENPRAVGCAIKCLGMLGIDIPPHPTHDQVLTEYRKVWETLGTRQIEDLADLPLNTNPEMQAAMRVLAVLFAPAFFTDHELLYLHLCHMVNISLRYGNTDASTHGYAWFGIILGPAFHRYQDGYRFGKLAFAVMEKNEFIGFKAKANYSLELIVFWIRPFQEAIDYVKAAFQAGVATGDLTVTCYCCNHTVTNLLTRGDPLEEVFQESVRRLDYVRQARFVDVEAIIIGIQRFIQNMRGLTATFSTFDGPDFDQGVFEAGLTEKRMPTMVCWYWVMKLAARFLSGDLDEALVAGEKARALIWASLSHPQMLDFVYYHALASVAVYGRVAPDRQKEIIALLEDHRARLREWADNCPSTFLDKWALVEAEIARITGKEPEAMRLYEQAIQAAHENGFVQNEGICYDLASRFYRERRFGKIADTYIREARACFKAWGADGKVRHLDLEFPWLQIEEKAKTAGRGDSSLGQLDEMAVIKASQAISGEIQISRLLDALMRILLESAGAQNGSLVLARRDELEVKAHAFVEGDQIKVLKKVSAPISEVLPVSIVNFVKRSHESVILNDATEKNLFSADDYFIRKKPISVLCLPVTRQASLNGLLYLENNLAKGAFSRDRVTVLELLASQAAISLENATLFSDLQRENSERKVAESALLESEERWRAIFENANDGILLADEEGAFYFGNGMICRMLGYTLEEIRKLKVGDIHPPEALPRVREQFDRQLRREILVAANLPVKRKDGTVFHADINSFPIKLGGKTFLTGFFRDISERMRGEEERSRLEEQLRQSQKMETVGLLAGGISHDFNNLLTPILVYSEMLMSRLADDQTALTKLRHIIEAAERARDLTQRLLAFSRKQVIQLKTVQLGKIIRAFESMLRRTIRENIQIDINLPPASLWVRADPGQIEQVLMNLSINAQDAMPEGGVLTITLSENHLTEPNPEAGPGWYVLLTVTDIGTGMDPKTMEHIFDPFFSTKEPGKGTGLGLSTVYGIVKQHGGFISAHSELNRGTTFRIFFPEVPGEPGASTLPATPKAGPLPASGNGKKGKTVLIVEDNDIVRTLACQMLEELGFKVLEADSGDSGIKLMKTAGVEVHLLLTDVILPRMNGKELYETLRGLHPDLKVLFMSGYPSTVIAPHGVLDDGINFIQKPFSLEEMKEKIHSIL